MVTSTNRRQNRGEMLQEFEANIARLVFVAYPSAPSDFVKRLLEKNFVIDVNGP